MRGWGRKENRIADLEARLEVAQRPRQDAALAADSTDAARSRRLTAEVGKIKTQLHTTEAQLGAARRRIDRLNGSLSSAQQRIATSEQIRIELAFLIAEHIARGSSIEALRKRVVDLGLAEIVDDMTRLIGDLDAEHADIEKAGVPARPAPAVTAGEVTAP